MKDPTQTNVPFTEDPSEQKSFDQLKNDVATLVETTTKNLTDIQAALPYYFSQDGKIRAQEAQNFINRHQVTYREFEESSKILFEEIKEKKIFCINKKDTLLKKRDYDIAETTQQKTQIIQLCENKKQKEILTSPFLRKTYSAEKPSLLQRFVRWLFKKFYKINPTETYNKLKEITEKEEIVEGIKNETSKKLETIQININYCSRLGTLLTTTQQEADEINSKTGNQLRKTLFITDNTVQEADTSNTSASYDPVFSSALIDRKTVVTEMAQAAIKEFVP